MKSPHLSIRTTLLAIIAVLNILIAALVGNGIYKSWIDYADARSLMRSSQMINALYETNKNLSQARASALAIIQVESETASMLSEDLMLSRKNADDALHTALTRLASMNLSGLSTEAIAQKHQILLAARKRLDTELTRPLAQRDRTIADLLYKANTDLIEENQAFILAFTKVSRGTSATSARQAIFKFFVWDLSEYAGREYAIIGRLIAEDRYPNAEQRQQLDTLRARIEYGWDILRNFTLHDELAQRILPFIDEAQTHYFLTFDEIKDLFYDIPDDISVPAGYPISIELWLGIAAQAVDSLLELQSEVMGEMQRHASIVEQKARQKILFSLLIFASALILSLYCWSIVVFRVARPINGMINALYRATQGEVYEMPKIEHKQDEIGKLVRVLETFQENAQKIKRSNEELERFAYIAAHDLKSPLRAVDNISQWLEEDLGQFLDESNKKHMKELRRRIQLMDRLLDDTLEYARVDARMDEAGEMTTAKALVDEVTGLLGVPPGFKVNTGSNLASIHIMKMPLQQVLYNLINNALKHHDRPEGTINIDVTDSGQDYMFTVRDDGPGIAPQYHQKIFEMFQTLQHDKSRGRGMGLAMVRKIVTSYGGTISVVSDGRRGTEFRFSWPKSGSRPGGRDQNIDDAKGQYA